MTVLYEDSHRRSMLGSNAGMSLEDKFEVIKEIGDGSFGSVSLARVRTHGAHVARKGSVIAIKTMKKTFDSLAPCLELREVIFLRTLPIHPHLVPALDIFLDPFSRKLHICMEFMDGNLYQLMKSRDHKCLDGASVKSILFQILAGLEHVHAHHFFHRDIKPENILVSTSAPQDSALNFRRYSLVTPPSTPPMYTVKIADFGLARETQSRLPYTTYVSTRWYRAPEVLLRAGEYSAPVDIWAIGAMAVEIATLKPLFPGGNEVDQVWRVCEIMGSPGNWYNKHGNRIGGGDWREGTKLASKLGFQFPRMAPHSIDSILQQPRWPASLSHFVTWCLMWDPRNRPTSTQALQHEYFSDAVDPLRPKSSASRAVSRKQEVRTPREQAELMPQLQSKQSWFRRSLINRDNSAPNVPQHAIPTDSTLPRPAPIQSKSAKAPSNLPKARPQAEKRSTWAGGLGAAPMPILPNIRPLSPLSDAVTAQARVRPAQKAGTRSSPRQVKYNTQVAEAAGRQSGKISRQLSVASSSSQTDSHRQQAERNVNSGLASPPSSHKGGSSFFSFAHLRKRARRLSGRDQGAALNGADDIEALAGCGPLPSNRSSMVLDQHILPTVDSSNPSKELDRVLSNVRTSLENTTATMPAAQVSSSKKYTSGTLKRQHSIPQAPHTRSLDNLAAPTNGPLSSRTRRALQLSTHPVHRYETPNEEEELLDEAMMSAQRARERLDKHVLSGQDTRRYPYVPSAIHIGPQPDLNLRPVNPYPTPSPSAKRNTFFGQNSAAKKPPAMDITKRRSEHDLLQPQWSTTPPYEESDWAASALASVWNAGGGAH